MNPKQKHWKINASSSLDNFKLSDSTHTIRMCSGHEFHRFWEFQNNSTIFSYTNHGFLVEEKVHEDYKTSLAGHQIDKIHRKMKVSSSLSNFNLSDGAHTIRICSGHEFHRFWEFENNSIIFSYKNHSFLVEREVHEDYKTCLRVPNPSMDLVDLLPSRHVL